MDSTYGYFYSKHDKELFHLQSKKYINIWIFIFVFFFFFGLSKFIKYADIQFVESKTVVNYIPFNPVLWRISMLVKFIILQKHTEGLHLTFKW